MTMPTADTPAALRETVRVGICVNDSRNGAFTSRMRALTIYDAGIECESPFLCNDDASRNYVSCYLMEGQPLRLRFAHLKVKIEDYRQWVGNWCWDEVTMTRADAKRLLTHLTLHRDWTITAAPVECDLLPEEPDAD